MSSPEFPSIHKDRLGRVIYAVHSEFERSVFRYYGDTSKIKVKYHYYNDDFYIDTFSRNGDVIFSTFSRNVFESHVERKCDGTIEFVVHPNKLAAINSLK